MAACNGRMARRGSCSCKACSFTLRHTMLTAIPPSQKIYCYSGWNIPQITTIQVSKTLHRQSFMPIEQFQNLISSYLHYQHSWLISKEKAQFFFKFLPNKWNKRNITLFREMLPGEPSPSRSTTQHWETQHLGSSIQHNAKWIMGNSWKSKGKEEAGDQNLQSHKVHTFLWCQANLLCYTNIEKGWGQC